MSRLAPAAPRTRRGLAAALHALALGAALLAPGSLAAQQAGAQTHTVVQGNTLWSLAQQYLGDPLLWPEIYRLNTAVVEDPHWIYPGEVLRLVPGEGVQAVPTQDTPAPLVADAAGEKPWEPGADADSLPPEGGLFPMMRQYSTPRETIHSYSEQNYRPVRRSEFYGAGFLSEEKDLPYGRVVARANPMQISSITNVGHAKLMTELEVSPPKGVSYQIGDSLLVVARDYKMSGYGDVVTPLGAAVVKRLDAGRPIATVIFLYDAVFPGAWTLPLEKFPGASKERAVPLQNGVEARVLGWQGRQELKLPQKYLFLDKGRAEGVALGDLFEVRSASGGYEKDGTARTDMLKATMQVVHVGDHSATAVVLNVANANVQAGDRVRQVAKLP
ncbi:MAG TPA: LysM peptidoglycan-binding domain-containing protein [Gemmatimonadales bacterium]|nr:LysM peptidoglycan-binding domain-containing protein [Gemmatimonadales bacterium]